MTDTSATVIPLRSIERVTAQSTVEALMYELSTRGLECFSTPANRRRLLDCDRAALEQIAKRLLKSTLQRPDPWPHDAVMKLVRLRATLAAERERP